MSTDQTPEAGRPAWMSQNDSQDLLDQIEAQSIRACIQVAILNATPMNEYVPKERLDTLADAILERLGEDGWTVTRA